ncbi:hypothetical protein GEMRC1_001278 [Eukaryota sp. GEM-RC1]
MAYLYRLPCNIQYSGPIDSSYFLVSEDDNSVAQSSFRGRKLLGKPLDVPSDYSLLLIDEEKVLLSPKIVVFEHDATPSSLPDIPSWVKLMSAFAP